MNQDIVATPRLFFHLLLIFTLSLFANGCASTAHLNLLQQGDTVAIVSAIDARKSEDFKISNQAVGEDAKTGVTSGAMVGAAWGLTCGPWAIICSPLGALLGAVGGAATGAIVGATKGIDADNTALINSKMEIFLRQNEPQQNLVKMVVERATKHYNVIPLPAKKEVIVQLDSLSLNAQSDGFVVLILQATTIIRYHDNDGKFQTRSKTFEYVSSPSYVASWADDSENFYQLRFDDAYRNLAENIVMALAYSK